MRNFIIKFILFGFIICFFVLSKTYSDDYDWNSYDNIWLKRNPTARYTILQRAIKHFKEADDLFKSGRYDKALILAKDALKVEPAFPEVFKLLSDIYGNKGNSEKRDLYWNKYIAIADGLSPLVEYAYLKSNLARLQKDYKPSTIFRILVLLFISFLVCGIIFLLFYITDALFYLKMFIRGLCRKKIKPEEADKYKKMFVDDFPGDDE